MAMNLVALTGRLTRDVELRYVQSGTSVADLGLAINQRVKRGEEWVDDPVFVDVTVWGRQADNCNKYLRKGSEVAIEGRLKLDRWETPEGQKRSKLKIVANAVHFMAKASEGPRGEDSPRPSSRPGEEYGPPDEYQDENVPF